ncbi:NADPH-dependent FMN reductase [Pedobacter sp. MC2016-24]|uniref:NADPH-dependent FMN reductase n=1 Tax=Pedobacter sp. MC2016-24 TaxID=2780090 RepID=UPI001881DB43|nr:NAD(P)H-dependent oxidoreductase [Pedobacter sp. MC2016-24]MBE9598233.1 NAD(P)H-dependent oxidoreductase [Pedobacter sp. MC2016-24]
MPHIVIISSSIRKGRNSHRTALYFKNFIENKALASVELLDLKAYNFPLFEERLRFFDQPTALMLEFAEKIKNADGVLIVTPEYNGGYPSSLKNVIDLLYDEWKRKPVAISTNSGGPFGGTQVITSLQFSLWKIGAWTVPAMFPVPKVQDAFDEEGIPSDQAGTDKRAKAFIDELLWCINAKSKMP